MPSGKYYEALKTLGIAVDTSFYNRYDALESNEDLEALFTLLNKYKDKQGNTPVLTALSIVANPDFDRIRKNNFESYFYEPVTQTLKSYGSSHDRVHKLWKEGKDKGLFYPEFHGREHFHINRWMRLLRENKQYRQCFEHGFLSIRPDEMGIAAKSHFPAFDLDNPAEIEVQKNIVKEGIELFKTIYGYAPKLFVPPNGIVHREIENYASLLGIDYLYGAKRQAQPKGDGTYSRKFRYTGKRNKQRQLFLGRNVQFEPAKTGRPDEWNKALNGIDAAFQLKKPAIISTHRVNYIGFIDAQNRINGLQQLDNLIKAILTQWPEVEFMTSTQLGELIKKDKEMNEN